MPKSIKLCYLYIKEADHKYEISLDNELHYKYDGNSIKINKKQNYIRLRFYVSTL